MAGNFRSGGHNAKNAAMRQLAGSKVRARHRAEPVYQDAVPEMPDFVAEDAIAKAQWEKLTWSMGAARVLNAAHGEMLGALCVTWADLVRSRRALAAMHYVPVIEEERMTATGEVVRTIKPNPLIRIIHQQTQQVARLLGEFGLSPITQGRVKARDADTVDPFEQFLHDHAVS